MGLFCLLISHLQDSKRGFRRPGGRKSSTECPAEGIRRGGDAGRNRYFDRSDRVLLGEPANSRPGEPGLFIMMVWVYILQSKSTGRFYCGQTTDVNRRLRQHNDPEYYLSKTTKRFKGPWKLLWSRECSDRSNATKLEMTIKKRGIGRYLKEAQPAVVPLRAGSCPGSHFDNFSPLFCSGQDILTRNTATPISFFVLYLTVDVKR